MILLAKFLGLDKIFQVVILVAAILAVIVAIGLGIALWVARGQVADMKKDVTEAQMAVARCEAESTGIRGAIDSQNAAVEAMKADAERRAADAKSVRVKAEKKASVNYTKAVTIKEAKPEVPTDLCASADRLLTEFMRGRQ